MSGGKRKLRDRDVSDVAAGDKDDDRARKTARQTRPGPCKHEDRNDSQNSASATSFEPLLDFSTLTTSEEIFERFEAVAQELLCNTILSVVRNGVRTDLDILEVEFYLQMARYHEDPFAHGAIEQERSGQWYFHRSPRRPDPSAPGLPVTAAGGYRGGTRKGLDVTVGGFTTIECSNVPVTIRGGALLRTVRLRTDNTVICGPSLLVDEILRLHGTTTITHLVDTIWNGDISAFSSLPSTRDTFMSLQRATSAGKSPTVYCSPRIGLDLSNSGTTESITHPRVIFVGKPYRFFTCPELLSSKGRAQTFLGLYTVLRESKGYPEESMELRKALQDVLRLGERTISKYMMDYRSGYRTGKLKSFVGPAGKGVCQSPTEYLKMMGALHKALGH